MGVRKRYQTFMIVALLVLTIGVYIGRQQATAMFHGDAGPDPAGHVSVIAFRDGEIFYEYEQHNLITGNGSKHLRNFLGFANQTNAACIYLSLSDDGAPATTWGKLPNEILINGLDRATGTPSVVNRTAYQVTYTWTATASDTVDVTGLHWDATDGSDSNMLAAADISSVSLQANDMLQVTWTVNIPDG
jgi:hypothetical protein